MSTSIRIGEIEQLPPGKGKVVEHGECQYTVYNLAGRFYATASHPLRPPHGAVESDCSLHGLIFDVFAEDSPARLGADEECCIVRVRDQAIWIEVANR